MSSVGLCTVRSKLINIHGGGQGQGTVQTVRSKSNKFEHLQGDWGLTSLSKLAKYESCMTGGGELGPEGSLYGEVTNGIMGNDHLDPLPPTE